MYQLTFLHALVGYVQLLKALIQKQNCIYLIHCVNLKIKMTWRWILFKWKNNNGICHHSSFYSLCNCFISVFGILDIFYGSDRGGGWG